jgi:hypothetical protein
MDPSVHNESRRGGDALRVSAHPILLCGNADRECLLRRPAGIRPVV